MDSLSLTAYTLVTALGAGRDIHLGALREGRGGLRPNDFCDLDLHIGRVEGLERTTLPAHLARFDCRNHRLAERAIATDGFERAVDAAVERHGPERVGVFVGTSTSGILETEHAFRDFSSDEEALAVDFPYGTTHRISAAADFVAARLALAGPVLAISTACSSSAKAFATAARYLATGLCDAAVVGGMDSLCFTTLHGFHALELTASGPCQPADAERDGLSIGEGAAFALLEREGATDRPRLLGYGESTDAYHMSSPHPQGEGARLAMERALARAGIAADRVDYINLHGTATPVNDAIEDLAVHAVFGDAVACSSTKGWTGHTLGAAGAVEAVLCALCLEHGFAPASLNTRRVDPAFRSHVLLEPEERPLRVAASNSFGFGGNNCTLVLAC